jgi:hypothetical protein
MGLMLKHLARRWIKPLVLGIDWQVDHLRMVLVGSADNPHQPRHKKLLGQWHLSPPLLSLHQPIQTQVEWQGFVTHIAGLLGKAPLHINVGLPNRLCTWLPCPEPPLAVGTNLITLQLHYQRMAAAALNIEPINLRVCHVQLATNLSFLVTTKRHYSDHIGQLVSDVHDAIEGSVVGCIEPQGLTRVKLPPWLRGLNGDYAMAWFMANKSVVLSC